MAALTTTAIIAAAGLAVAGAGTYLQYQGSQQSQKANAQALAEQQKQEQLRQQQAQLDAERRKREIIRQQLAARAYALSTATNQGVSGEFAGSGLPGVYGGISGRTNVNELGVNQALELGGRFAASNANIYQDYRSAAAGTSTAYLGAGLTSLGGMAINNIGSLSRIGDYFSGLFSPRASADPGVRAFNSGSAIY